MKTAISLPDELFERVEKGVAELGVSRSEFFARAATAYLEELERRSLTAQINADRGGRLLVSCGRRQPTCHGRPARR